MCSKKYWFLGPFDRLPKYCKECFNYLLLSVRKCSLQTTLYRIVCVLVHIWCSMLACTNFFINIFWLSSYFCRWGSDVLEEFHAQDLMSIHIFIADKGIQIHFTENCLSLGAKKFKSFNIYLKRSYAKTHDFINTYCEKEDSSYLKNSSFFHCLFFQWYGK